MAAKTGAAPPDCNHLFILFIKRRRNGEIRTHDLFHPKEARYQAALRSVTDLFSLEMN